MKGNGNTGKKRLLPEAGGSESSKANSQASSLCVAVERQAGPETGAGMSPTVECSAGEANC